MPDYAWVVRVTVTRAWLWWRPFGIHDGEEMDEEDENR